MTDQGPEAVQHQSAEYPPIAGNTFGQAPQFTAEGKPVDGKTGEIVETDFAASFAELMERIDPWYAREMGELLQQVAQAVYSTEKAGTVTLKLSVKRVANSDMITITSTVGESTPKADLTGLFYLDKTGSLTDRDPRQPDLPGIGPDRG